MRRWTGLEARALRHASRMSVRAFAEHLGAGIRTVAKWEGRGATIVPSPEMQAVLDTALQRADEETQSRFELLLESREQSWEGGEEDAANRREATKLLGLTLGAVAQPSAAEVLARSTSAHDRGRVDEQLVAGHEEVSAALSGLYRSADPRAAFPAAMSYADGVLALLDQPMRDRARSRLFPVIVGVHAQVGLWACHSGQVAVARRYLATACDVAASSGDSSLHARALGALSYLSSSAPRGGQGGAPQRTLALLDQALDLAARADGFTRGWLATWRADQHATLGNITAARADIQTAERGLSEPDNGTVQGFFSRPTYGYGMAGHLDSVRAFTLAISGATGESDQLFDRVLSSAANERRRVATYGHIALARAAARAPEAACHALTRAIVFGSRGGYTMGIKRAAGVRAGFDQRWSPLDCVRDIDEQLREVGASAREEATGGTL